MGLLNCANCGKEFKVTPNRMNTAKFCSVICKAGQQAATTKEEQAAWKGGRIKKKNGYIAIRRSGIYVYEHRAVMESKLGRALTKEETVHHLDGDKENNSEGNLVVMPKKSHDKHETTQRWANHNAGIKPFRRTT